MSVAAVVPISGCSHGDDNKCGLQHSLSNHFQQGRPTEYPTVHSTNFFTGLYTPRILFRGFGQRGSSSLWSLEETQAREARWSAG